MATRKIDTSKKRVDNGKDIETSVDIWGSRSIESIIASKISRISTEGSVWNGKCPFEELIEIHDHESGER